MDLSRRKFGLLLGKGAAGIAALGASAKLAQADSQIPEALKPQDVCPESVPHAKVDIDHGDFIRIVADAIDQNTQRGWTCDRDKFVCMMNPHSHGNLMRGMIRLNKRDNPAYTGIPKIEIEAYEIGKQLSYTADDEPRHIDDGAYAFSFAYSDNITHDDMRQFARDAAENVRITIKYGDKQAIRQARWNRKAKAALARKKT